MNHFKVTILFSIILLLFSCKKDPCDATFCFNGGICISGTCNCPEGYSGLQCETFDICTNITCLNGGVCVTGLCNCPEGYSGLQCENFNPCANITCLNGGTCANGICNCPEGYTGSNCGIALTPNSMTITKIDILDYPVVNSSGGGWDLTTGADPYITMSLGTSSDSDDNITGYVENVTGNPYSLTLSSPQTISNLGSSWSIGMWDYDTPDADDFMGGINFTPTNYDQGFPSSFTLTTNSISFRLYINWNF
jgi:hypothetical protein